jgi:hypothetical protein
MSSGISPHPEEVVRLELDVGSYELGVDECSELVRRLRRKSERAGEGPADASANRLESLLGRRVGIVATARATEDELDAIADAAWDWLRSVGRADVPERVLVVLDVLRARHAHE